MRGLNYVLNHWTTFGAIALEQPLIAMTVQRKVELPDQIPNVMQSGIHSLPPKRTVNVRGIAGYEESPDAQLCYLPVMDAKITAPMQSPRL
jgi:hypothetical protein